MFGRKVTETRNLDDMFTEDDSVLYENLEESEESFEDCFECANNEITTEDVFEQIKSAKGETINPMDCFGMEEQKSDKWLSNCIKFWFCCMSLLWFLFGAITFAPVIFIRDKVDVVFRDKKKSLLCAITIHVFVLSLSCILLFL